MSLNIMGFAELLEDISHLTKPKTLKSTPSVRFFMLRRDIYMT